MEEITLNRMLRSIDKQKTRLIKAKEIIKDLLKVLPKENIEGVYEVIEAAEEFLRDTGYTKPVRPGSEPNAFRGLMLFVCRDLMGVVLPIKVAGINVKAAECIMERTDE